SSFCLPERCEGPRVTSQGGDSFTRMAGCLRVRLIPITITRGRRRRSPDVLYCVENARSAFSTQYNTLFARRSRASPPARESEVSENRTRSQKEHKEYRLLVWYNKLRLNRTLAIRWRGRRCNSQPAPVSQL